MLIFKYKNVYSTLMTLMLHNHCLFKDCSICSFKYLKDVNVELNQCKLPHLDWYELKEQYLYGNLLIDELPIYNILTLTDQFEYKCNRAECYTCKFGMTKGGVVNTCAPFYTLREFSNLIFKWKENDKDS